MKSTILSAVILSSLAGPVPVFAEIPAATAKPLAVEVTAIDTEPTEQQEIFDRPANAAAPATEMLEVQAPADAPAEVLATNASAAGTATPKPPCPMHGMGMMHKGMGQGGKGPGGGRPGCDHDGRGQQNNQTQVLRRLDMIEARIAKIEVMLESLMQR